MARWPSGKAEACKAFIPGSNPGLASSELTTPASAGVSFCRARPCLLEFWIASLKSAKNLYLRHRFFDKIRQIHRFFYLFRQKLQILCRNQAHPSVHLARGGRALIARQLAPPAWRETPSTSSAIAQETRHPHEMDTGLKSLATCVRTRR